MRGSHSKSGEVWNNYFGGFPIYGKLFPGEGNKLFHPVECHASEMLCPSQPVERAGKWVSGDEYLENMKTWEIKMAHDLDYELPWRLDRGRILSEEFMLKMLNTINRGGILFGE